MIVEQLLRKILLVALVWICLVSTVKAIGVGPVKLDLTIEKGKETELVQYITVMNSETNPIHVVVSVSGPISEYVTIPEPEFDMPAGPGMHSREPRPYRDVKVIFTIPRELPDREYAGEIVFTQQPVEGGHLGAAVQLGVAVDLSIGKMAMAEFPLYVNLMIFVLLMMLVISMVYLRWGKR